jgi:hypothetical protein
MSLKEYIYNLQQRPERERKRIAVIATAVCFSIILLIWIVSFSEMNKSNEVQAPDQASQSLNDLKTNFQEGKDSIQNMIQDLPGETAPTGSPNAIPSNGNLNTGDNMPSPDSTSEDIQNKNESVPQLP